MTPDTLTPDRLGCARIYTLLARMALADGEVDEARAYLDAACSLLNEPAVAS